MEKIFLRGEIGWDVLPFQVQESFERAAGDDIEVIFSTPGGILGAGLDINSIISSYKKENPKSQLIAHILEASSMGSHIASNPSFDMRTAEETSIAMIHNPQNGRIGDYRLMRKNADFLERLAGVMGLAYMKVLKVNVSEMRNIMDEETWYVGGKALVKAGLADDIITTNSSGKTKEVAYSEAEIRFKSVMEKVRLFEIKESDFEKVAALVKDYDPSIFNPQNQTQQNQQVQLNSTQPATGGNNNNQEDVLMDSKELKAKHPEIYAEVLKAGQDEEKTGRAERVKALLEMKKRKDFEGIPEISERVDEGIEKDESVQSVELGIFALFKKNGTLAAMDTNNIGDINPPTDGSVSGEPGKSNDKGEF